MTFSAWHLYDFIAQLAVLVSPLVAVHRLVQKEAKNKRNSMTTHLSDSKTIFSIAVPGPAARSSALSGRGS